MEEYVSFFNRAPAQEVGNCCVIPESALRPLVGKASQFLRVLKIDLLDMDGAIPEAGLRQSKAHLERRWAWRAFVKSAEMIYEVLMALQAAALLPSAFSIPKEGKSSVSLKESSLFGISLSDHVKVESSSSALRFKVRLIGHCVEGSLFLVYEFIDNGNLSEHMYGLDLREDKQFFVDHPGVVPITTAQGDELKRLIGDKKSNRVSCSSYCHGFRCLNTYIGHLRPCDRSKCICYNCNCYRNCYR